VVDFFSISPDYISNRKQYNKLLLLPCSLELGTIGVSGFGVGLATTDLATGTGVLGFAPGIIREGGLMTDSLFIRSSGSSFGGSSNDTRLLLCLGNGI